MKTPVSCKGFRSFLAAAQAALFALLLLFPATGPILAQSDSPANTAPIATGESAPSDAEIDKRIEAIFDEIEGLSSVFVTVHSGVVTLRGRVTESDLYDRAGQLAGRVEGVVEVNNRIETVTEVTKRLVPVWERLKGRVVQALNYLPLLLVAVTVFTVVAAVGWWIAARKFPWSTIAPNAFIAELMRQIIRLAFLGAGILIALDILGSTALLGTILGAAGIVGLAIGFAVRDTVENYIASILLSIRQPFRPMDYVDIEGTEGSVLGLTSRATILMDANGNHIRIPNATVFKAKILNYDRNPHRRFTFLVHLAPAGSVDVALAKGVETLRSLDFVLDNPAADCWIEDTTGSSVILWFSGWVDQTQTSYAKARSEAIRQVSNTLAAAGFKAPEPGYRISVDGDLKGKAASDAQAKTRVPAKLKKEAEAVVDTTVDENTVHALEEERARLSDNDLLDDHAPQEIE